MSARRKYWPARAATVKRDAPAVLKVGTTITYTTLIFVSSLFTIFYVGSYVEVLKSADIYQVSVYKE